MTILCIIGGIGNILWFALIEESTIFNLISGVFCLIVSVFSGNTAYNLWRRER